MTVIEPASTAPQHGTAMAAAEGTEVPLVLVSVGTDHHPFDRLVGWVETWAQAWAEDRGTPVRLVVQHGHSAPSRTGENHTIVPRAQLLELFRTATLVASQVGPGTILDANAVGRRPVVVARDPARGEHVDGHQIVFGQFMAERGHAWLASTQEEMHALLDAAAADPEFSRVPPRPSPADDAATALGQVVDEVLARRPGVLSVRGVRRMLRRP